MAKLQFVFILLIVFMTTTASGSPIFLPVDPGIVGQPSAGRFHFPFNELNGVTLSGQAFSSHFVFADDILGRLLFVNDFFVGLTVQTNASSFPGFAGSGPTGFLLAPDGTPLDAPIGAGRAASSDGRFSVGLSILPASLGKNAVDMEGVHFDLLFPGTGFVVTGAEIQLNVNAPSTIQFGTAAQLPEHSALILLALSLGVLLCGHACKTVWPLLSATSASRSLPMICSTVCFFRAMAPSLCSAQD